MAEIGFGEDGDGDVEETGEVETVGVDSDRWVLWGLVGSWIEV